MNLKRSSQIWAVALTGMGLLAASLTQSSACSRIFWNDNGKAMVVARCNDLYLPDNAQMILSSRGVERDGMPGSPKSLKWKAKYGSVGVVCFNAAVSDGMNEKGLSANYLYLLETSYPKPDPNLPELNYALLIQYLLDNCATVQEALDAYRTFSLMTVKVMGKVWPQHVSLQDATGDSAIVEFVDGKMTVHHGKQYQVMTNDPSYDAQLENLKKYKAFGGTLPLPAESTPIDRFVRASAYLKNLPDPKSTLEALAGVYSVIRTTAVPFGTIDPDASDDDVWPTLWFTLADLTDKNYYFQSTTIPNLFWVGLNELPLEEGQPVRAIDAYDPALTGDISSTLAKGQPWVQKIPD